MATSKTPKNPLESESTGFAEFDFRGAHFKVPTGKNLPLKAVKALENNQSVAFVEIVLGNDWPKAEPLVPTLGDLEELADAITKAMNSSSGE